MILDVVSTNGIDVCFEEERKRLDDILCHDLELMSLLLRSFAIFSMYSCFAMRMDAITELRFALNCVQIFSLFDFFARLKSSFLCLVCLLMFDLIHGGSFGLTVISLNGMDCFAASMIMLETLSAISSTLFAADIKLQSFSLRSRLYLL